MEYKFTADNFDAEVLQAAEPVLVDFYADWCNPCRMMGPVVAKMAEAFEGRLKVGKCNIDENMQLAQTYRISSIPAFVVFKGGKPVANYVGAMSAADFQAKIEQVLIFQISWLLTALSANKHKIHKANQLTKRQ